MCGRFAFIPKYEKLHYQFNLSDLAEITPHYNISPGATVLFLCSSEVGQINPLYLKWGLIPSWSKDKKIDRSYTNARAETIFEKHAFHTIKSKRGMVIMSGFYEWRAEQGKKQPYYFKQINDDYLAIAAFWDTWQSGEEVIHSCCLITTSANDLINPIHNRMPVIISKENQSVWLNNEEFHPELLKSIMQPYSGTDLDCFPVTREMNYSVFDLPSAIKPLVI